jgi:hypothetical protein
MATPAPSCPHGTHYAQPCYGCGWICPTCKRSYAPWVRECSYSHDWQERMCVASGTLASVTQLQFRFPPEWSQPGYQHLVRAGTEWRDILPGLQCRLSDLIPDAGLNLGACEVILRFRLTPDPESDDPA